MPDVPIIYEDSEIIVVEKRPGTPVQAKSVTANDLESMLRVYSAGRFPIYVVHRLDQWVGGVIVFAKTKKAAADLSAQLTDGRMTKIYHARVNGVIKEESGELVDYLIKDAKNNRAVVIKKGEPIPKGAKEARLTFARIGDDELEIKLGTGRFHQIRAQLASAGMPVKGDRKYGANDTRGGNGPLQLYACRLSFVHPKTGKRMEFEAKAPFDGE